MNSQPPGFSTSEASIPVLEQAEMESLLSQVTLSLEDELSKEDQPCARVFEDVLEAE